MSILSLIRKWHGHMYRKSIYNREDIWEWYDSCQSNFKSCVLGFVPYCDFVFIYTKFCTEVDLCMTSVIYLFGELLMGW